MRFLKGLRVLALLFMVAFAAIGADAASENNDFDWDPVVDAIIHVESRGNAGARNGQYVGVLQMSPAVVKAVNQILQKRGSSKRYSLKDRYSESKSREMCDILMSTIIRRTMWRKPSVCGKVAQAIQYVLHKDTTAR